MSELTNPKITSRHRLIAPGSILCSFQMAVVAVPGEGAPTASSVASKVTDLLNAAFTDGKLPAGFDSVAPAASVGALIAPEGREVDPLRNPSSDPCDVTHRLKVPQGEGCDFYSRKGEDACHVYYTLGPRMEVSPCKFMLDAAVGKCAADTSCADRAATEAANELQSAALKSARRDCDNRQSCDTCTQSDSCGWCAHQDLGEGQGTCMMGGPPGPLDDATGQYGKEMLHREGCTSWEFAFCPASPCSGYTSCAGCLGDPFCGWCSSSGKCTEGDTAGPIAGLSDGCRRGWIHAVIPHSSTEDFANVMQFDATAKHDAINAHCEETLDETRELVRLDIEHEAATNSTWRYQIQTCAPCGGQYPKCDCGGNKPEEDYEADKIKVLEQDDEATLAIKDPGEPDPAKAEAEVAISAAASDAAGAAMMVKSTYSGLVEARSQIPEDPERVARLETAYAAAQAVLAKKQRAYNEALSSMSLVAKGKKESLKELAAQWSEALRAESAAVNAKAMAEKHGDPAAVEAAQALIDQVAKRAAAAEQALKVATTGLDGSEDAAAGAEEDRKRNEGDKIAMHAGILNAISATLGHNDGLNAMQKTKMKDVMKQVVVQMMKSIKAHGGGEVDPESVRLIRESVGFPETPAELAQDQGSGGGSPIQPEAPLPAAASCAPAIDPDICNGYAATPVACTNAEGGHCELKQVRGERVRTCGPKDGLLECANADASSVANCPTEHCVYTPAGAAPAAAAAAPSPSPATPTPTPPRTPTLTPTPSDSDSDSTFRFKSLRTRLRHQRRR